jgi:glutathione S-transferase
MLRLHDDLTSGNGFKVRLLLAQLGLPYERVQYDIDRRETRTAEFLLKNPNGRIPVLELEDGTFLAESDAILWYLAEGTRFLPDNRRERAERLRPRPLRERSRLAGARRRATGLRADHSRVTASPGGGARQSAGAPSVAAPQVCSDTAQSTAASAPS